MNISQQPNGPSIDLGPQERNDVEQGLPLDSTILTAQVQEHLTLRICASYSCLEAAYNCFRQRLDCDELFASSDAGDNALEQPHSGFSDFCKVGQSREITAIR